MILELLEDITKLALVVAGLYLAFGAYVRREHRAWSGPMARRRIAILSAFVLAVSAVKVTEDVLGGESGPVDKTILVFIHSHVPVALTEFLEAITLTGSAPILVPLATTATIALLFLRRRIEALVLAGSVISGALVVYVVKTAVGRARPELWQSEWYWGSSFPSGHTLVVAAFSMSGVICVSRIRPAARGFALSIALVWILLVALSRLALGAHWPSDVLAAACVGAFLPLAIGVALEFRGA